jgi:hypothetical protein
MIFHLTEADNWTYEVSSPSFMHFLKLSSEFDFNASRILLKNSM